MRKRTAEPLSELMANPDPPCVSIYQPTHRNHPEDRQDPIRFRNLLREVEVSLRRVYPSRGIRPLLERLQELTDSSRFSVRRHEGMAVFVSPSSFRVVDLRRSVPELAVVADSFHIKPLVRLLQAVERYHVLCLNRQSVRLFEGEADHLEEIELVDIPSTLTEALGEELTEPHLTVASYRLGSWAPHAPHGQPASYHGHGSRRDEIDADCERFFRLIDGAILERYSRPSGLPLVLAALPEHHARFRAVSRNPFLAPEGVELNPEAISTHRLGREVWARLEPRHLARLDKLADDFRAARMRGLGSDRLEDVVPAALGGRVDTLLVEADREIPGTIEPMTGRVRRGSLSHPAVDDLLDDVAEATLRRGGQVLVVPGARMPSPTGLAAIYRF